MNHFVICLKLTKCCKVTILKKKELKILQNTCNWTWDIIEIFSERKRGYPGQLWPQPSAWSLSGPWEGRSKVSLPFVLPSEVNPAESTQSTGVPKPGESQSARTGHRWAQDCSRCQASPGKMSKLSWVWLLLVLPSPSSHSTPGIGRKLHHCRELKQICVT